MTDLKAICQRLVDEHLSGANVHPPDEDDLRAVIAAARCLIVEREYLAEVKSVAAHERQARKQAEAERDAAILRRSADEQWYEERCERLEATLRLIEDPEDDPTWPQSRGAWPECDTTDMDRVTWLKARARAALDDQEPER